MNILYIKYAVEVAKTGSVNKAADKLYIAQPNLSRAIKELESDLGTQLFKRTSHGMMLTSDGEKFINYAEHILSEMDEIQSLFDSSVKSRIVFSLSAPDCSCISSAFAKFTGILPYDAKAELKYKAAPAANTIIHVSHSEYRIGIIRYDTSYDSILKKELAEKGLNCEIINESKCDIIINSGNPLSSKPAINEKDLERFTEIAYDEFYDPIKKPESKSSIRQIYLYESSARFDLISSNPDIYMRGCGILQDTLDKYGLVRKRPESGAAAYRDALIYKSTYRLTDYDKLFISCLNETLHNI